MKKIVLMILMLGIASNVFAASNYLPNGKYVCIATAIADKNWKTTFKLSEAVMKNSVFTLQKTGSVITDSAGAKYTYSGSSGDIDVYSLAKSGNIVIKDETIKLNEATTIGFAKKRDDGTYLKMKALCKRVK